MYLSERDVFSCFSEELIILVFLCDEWLHLRCCEFDLHLVANFI